MNLLDTYERRKSSAQATRAGLASFGLRAGLLVAAVGWLCWPSLERMLASWSHLPQYSHGYLVPVFAGLILWSYREELFGENPVPSTWGLPLIGLGLALKLAGTAYFYDYIDDVALIPLLWGALIVAGGFRAWLWSWSAVLFLLFMIPLPFRLETGLQQTLLKFAAQASTYTLQTLGYAAFAEGNVIHLRETTLGVSDACSGMRMSIVCTSLAALIALLSTTPVPLRLIIALSGLPLALLVNVVRICAMGIGAEAYGAEAAKTMLHDPLGYLMMPLALVMLGLEFWLLCWIYDLPGDDEHRRPMYVGQIAGA